MPTLNYLTHIQAASRPHGGRWNYIDGMQISFVRDLKLHLENTIAWAVNITTQKRELVYIQDISETDPDDHRCKSRIRYHIAPMLATGRSGETRATLSSKVEMVPFVPEGGLYNLRNGCGYLMRLPHRQWKLSLSQKGYTMYRHLLHDEMVEELRLTMRDVGAHGFKTVAHALANPTEVSVEKALASVVAGERIASVINKSFAIAKPARAHMPMLVYKRHLVGSINGDGVVELPSSLDYLLPSISNLMECTIQ